MSPRRLVTRASDESGSVIVIVAASLLVLVLVAVFVVDVGNWFVHKRHLQTQADAAALAAANALTYPCDWPSAQAVGAQYGDAPYNPQIGPAGNITVLFNSPTFASGVPPAADDTPSGSPCDTGVVDVKATEDHTPLFFSGLLPGLDVVINAQARAAVRRVQAMSGFLPLAVEDPEPKHVFAQFVRADTGTPPAGCDNDCVVWLDQPNATLPVWTQSRSVTVPTSLSLTVGLVYSKTRPSGPDYCPADSASVQCYRDVSYVRGWSSGAAPSLGNVQLLPGTCSPDGYFSTAPPCSLGLAAELDAGATPLTAWATVPGDTTKYGLGPRTASGNVTRSLDSGLPISNSGTTTVAIHWGTCEDPAALKRCTEGTGSPVSVAQRIFVNDGSIPLDAVKVGQYGPDSSGANTFQAGSTQTLQVTVHVASNLAAAADASDPTVMLRTASGTRSNSQAVDCDAGVTFRDEVKVGCETPYQINVDAVCPNADSPASCIPTQTGDFLGQLRQGLDERFGCPVNNWTTDSPGNISLDDPRLVALLIVPPASFVSPGSHLVPVIKFAFFYVTGWDGATPCSANEDYPGARAPHGDVWGHFFKYTGYVPDATPSDDPCDLQSGDPGACVVALTR